MKNFLTYLSLLGITVFLLMILPFSRHFILDFTSNVLEKRDNVVEEYERVKGKFETVGNKVTEKKKDVEKTINSIHEVVDSVSDTVDKVNGVMGQEESEDWRKSDPEVDPSIDAGRTNYNVANPGQTGLSKEHLELDIQPWIEDGNSPQDESTKEERIAALAESERGRLMLEVLGYEY